LVGDFEVGANGYCADSKFVILMSPSFDSRLLIFCWSSPSSFCIRFDFEIESFKSYDLETGLSSKLYYWSS